MPCSPTGPCRLVSLLKRTSVLTLAVLLAGIVGAPRTFAHGGQIEITGGARGPVQLSAAQQLAIALKSFRQGRMRCRPFSP